MVFKSGPLFLLFKSDRLGVLEEVLVILTCTLLIFFKNDLNALLQRGGEVNLALGS